MPESDNGKLWKNPWWGVVAVAFLLGGWAVRIEGQNQRQDEVDRMKADTLMVQTVRREQERQYLDIRARVDSVSTRLSQYVCSQQPRREFCR